MTCRREWFLTFDTTDVQLVYLGDGSVREAIDELGILIKRNLNGIWHDGHLDNVPYVSVFNKNLYFTSAVTLRGIRVIFYEDQVELRFKKTDEIVAQARRISNNLCVLDLEEYLVLKPIFVLKICS